MVLGLLPILTRGVNAKDAEDAGPGLGIYYGDSATATSS